MIRFDVPFLPDDRYIRFLADRLDRIDALHFSLYSPAAADARVRLRRVDADRLIHGLGTLHGPRKHALLNSRFHDPSVYGDDAALAGLAKTLRALADASVLDGIIFADLYHLRSLSDAAPDLARRLTAVPSVNFMIDGVDKAVSVADAVARTRFRAPDRLVLDRSLNRRPERLEAVAAGCRAALPGIAISLLANEGCLHQCPFKPAHDAQIALVNMGRSADTLAINRAVGCVRHLSERPHEVLRSPFIRPEDLGRYAPVADGIKLCGRTLGPGFLMRVIEAYMRGRYDGNLLDLLDAVDWMAERHHLPNADLPGEFLHRLTSCEGACEPCGYCRDLFSRIARRRRPRLGDLRDRPGPATPPGTGRRGTG